MLETLVGRHRARAKTWTLTESAQKQTPEVAVEFEIVHPDAEGATITWHGYLTDGTFARTIESLRYCGWKGDDLADIQGLGTNEVELDIQEEEYQGTLRPKVKWVNRGGGINTEPMSVTKAKQFATSMRSKIRALDAERGWNDKKAAPAPAKAKAPAKAAREPSPPLEEPAGDEGEHEEPPQDDIPF